MTKFKIVDYEKLSEIPPGWNTVDNFRSKNTLVDEQKQIVASEYNGRKCRVISKVERNHSLFLRILRALCGSIVTVGSLGIAYLYSNQVRSLFKKRAESITYGVKEAFSWNNVAAQKGEAPAMRNLGIMYLQGKGVACNYKEGIEWLQKAMNAGDPVARFALAIERPFDKRLEGSEVEAEKILTINAQNDDPIAMVYLGIMYRNGLGVPQDTEKAFSLFKRAAAMKDARGMFCYQNKFSERWREGAKNYEKATKILQEAAKLGDPLCLLTLGERYLAGNGVPADTKEAIRLFQQASDTGHPEAKLRLSTILLSDELANKDLKRSTELVQEVASMGDARGIFFLARAYENGTGIEKNLEKAISLYEQASNEGYSLAMYALINLYTSKADEVKANYWREKYKMAKE
jgi:TPR repeat protein